MTETVEAITTDAPDVPHTERWERVHMPNYGTPRLMFTEGEGARLKGHDGRTYVDLLAGLAVNIVGHAHPEVVKAVSDQVARLGHVSNLYASDVALRLCERLHALSGGRKVMLVNSGAEANEAALKVVRRHAHMEGMDAPVVVAFNGSFHGRTLGALALTGQPAYQEGFGPLPGGVVHVPFNDPAALEQVFEEHQVAGFFAEFLQGEGGVVPMARETADTLSRLKEAHGTVLVADEVQTGMGRTGHFFAHEHFAAKPDIITLAKALGGGMPIGAMLVRPDLAAKMGPGSHGTTFGGNPVSSAAALAVLDIYERENLGRRAARLGLRLSDRLTDALAPHGLVPRGLGMLQGVPLPKPVAPEVVRRAEEDGVIIGQAGKSVVRFAPPLTIGEDELYESLPVVVDAIASSLSSG
ncbi:MAG: acetylornithine/succinylornithine family transaminase [Euryarchaeota archaeon]|nr:acetylornithine/succinylornithine family transaminase [Euryarchaeota archaeon]